MSIGAGVPPPIMTGRLGAIQTVGRGARRLGGDASLALGCGIVGSLILLVSLAPALAPSNPNKQDIGQILAPPGTPGHLLGTDALGRDVLSRLLYGGRIDLFVALGALILPFAIGVLVGTVAGYRGGALDGVLVGVVDVVFAFPILVLLIALVFVLGPGITTIVVAVTAVDWVAYARLTRTLARRERVMEYVLAARVGGVPQWRIVARHVLPNIIAQPVVYAMSDAVGIILFITTLGFLGLGVQPPSTDWGTMIADAQNYLDSNWWLAVIPGVAICLAGLGLSLIADGLAQRLDAR
jgi:peptide/nickel transport system permease protein